MWFFTSHEQSFSYKGMGLPGLNQDKARINVSCSRTQRSDAGDALTQGPSVSSQALYHWATALLGVNPDQLASERPADQDPHCKVQELS